MGNNKVLLAGIIGAVTLFILGFIVYGMLMGDFMATNTGAPGVNKPMEEISFGWLVVSNLASGFFLAVVFGRYANINTASAGFQAGAVLGFLMAMGVDTAMYGTTNLYNMKAMWADVVMWTVMSAITGGVVAYVLGMKKKVATA
jgi:hypothetical protein